MIQNDFTPASQTSFKDENSRVVWSPGVVAQGVQRCVDWFANRWTACLEAIPVPVINYILCISMKFHFLCDIMKGKRLYVPRRYEISTSSWPRGLYSFQSDISTNISIRIHLNCHQKVFALKNKTEVGLRRFGVIPLWATRWHWV